MQRYDSYKDSGIQWLGQIPEHWDIKKLKVFCKENKTKNKGNVVQKVLSLSYGHIKVKEDKNFGLVPENYESYQIVSQGDIILRLTDLQNDHKSLRTGLVLEEGIITSAYVGLKIDQQSSAYIQLLLHTYDIFKLFYSMGGGLRQSMSYADVSKLSICIPPLPEQEGIVQYLDCKTKRIDAYVAERERELQLLSELKQSEVANVVTKGLHPEVKMKDSGIAWIGQIPEHWEVKRNKAFFYTTKEIIGEKFVSTPLLSLTTNGIKEKDITKSFGKTPESYDGYQIVNPNDLVLCLFDLDCSAVFSGRSDLYGMISPAYKVVKCRNGMLPEYAELWFRYVFQGRKYKPFSKSLRYTLTFDEFGFISIIVPPIDEQREIVDYINHRCETVNKLTTELEAEIAYLKEYKQRLIADAVTGQIKVC